MKKITSLLMLLCVMTLSVQSIYAQTESETSETVEAATDSTTESDTDEVTEEAAAPAASADKGTMQIIKEKFIEGDPLFMVLPLLCLILGLAIAIERVISLFWMSINTDKFVAQIEEEVAAGNIDGAKEFVEILEVLSRVYSIRD